MQRDGFSIEAGIEKGRSLPRWFEDAPALSDGDDFYIKAFWDLSSGRPVGFSIGPIPWRDIILYSDRAGLASDVSAAFVVIIRAMDMGYLEWQAKEQERTSPKTGRGKGR